MLGGVIVWEDFDRIQAAAATFQILPFQWGISWFLECQVWWSPSCRIRFKKEKPERPETFLWVILFRCSGGQFGQGSEQADLVEDVPIHCRGIGLDDF